MSDQYLVSPAADSHRGVEVILDERAELRTRHRRFLKRELLFNYVCAAWFVIGIVASFFNWLILGGTLQLLSAFFIGVAVTMLISTLRDIRRSLIELRDMEVADRPFG